MTGVDENRDRSIQTVAPDGRLTELPHTIIRASAGTGKTFQLSNRYLRLILSDKLPERILATTFTRKAAGEILDRILLRLAKAAESPDRVQQLAGELELPSLSVADCRSALRRLTRQLHRLRVATLDAFFLQATQNLSLELGLPPSWQIMDEADASQLREQAITSMLATDDSQAMTSLLHWLAKGATNRSVSRILQDTVSAMYGLYLESEPEAWQKLPRQQACSAEELQAIEQRLQEWIEQAQPKASLRKAIDTLLGDIAAGRWEEAVGKGICSKLLAGESMFNRQPIPDELIRIVTPLIQHVRAELQNRLSLQTEASYEVLHRYHTQFEALKIARRTLTFDDLARHLGRLEKHTELSQLSYRLDSSIEGLLLDEFQDTSLDQWRALRPLAHHASADVQGRSFLCVGDLKQAIYGWRGGNSELLDAVATELGSLDDQSLDHSYRSSPAVIEVVNRINEQMGTHNNLERCRPAVSAWVERFPHHTTERTLPGYVTVMTTDWAKAAKDQRDLAIEAAVLRVEQLRHNRADLSIAILVRTNQLVGMAMHQLQRRGILASEEGGNPLTDSAAVQLVLSLLQLSDHPQDNAARFHLAESPWSTQLEFTDFADDLAAIRLARRVRTELAEFGYGETLSRWAEQLGRLTNQRERRRLAQLVESADDYQQLVESPGDVACTHQHAMPNTSVEFVRRVEQLRVADPTEDPVRVMTIHQSKGLEFDVVILPDLERGLVPQNPTYVVDRTRATEPIDTVVRYAPSKIRSLLPDQICRVHDRDLALQIREVLSVMYVALTRATCCLEMIIAPSHQVVSGDSAAKSEPSKSPTAKPLPKTMAGLIRAALTDGLPLDPSTRVFEHGDGEWQDHLRLRPQRTTSGIDEKSNLIRLKRADDRSAVAARKVSPSALEGGGRVRLSSRLTAASQTAMLHGTLIHAFFERVNWLDDGLPDWTELRRVGLAVDADDHRVTAALEDFRRMLQQPSLRAVLSRGRYQSWFNDRTDQCNPQLDVRCEQQLIAADQAGLLQGSIDRLVLMMSDGRPVAAEIIDFKTDDVRIASAQHARVDFYRPQLLAYRRGLSRMLRLDMSQITAGLLFVHSGQWVEVADD